MKLLELFESSQEDINQRHKVDIIANNIISDLRNGLAPDKFIKDDNSKYFIYFPSTLNMEELPTTLFCLKQIENNTITGMAGKLTQKMFDIYDQIIIINCLKTFNIEAIIQVSNNAKFISILKHELTHCFDIKRTSGNILNKNIDIENNKNYFNDDAEFNAYYNDFASKLLSIAKMKNSENFDKIFKEAGFNGDFYHDISKLIIDADLSVQNFLDWISQKNHKKLLKRIYKLHSFIME